MTFRWPELLWLLAIVPAIVWLYLWLLRRRKRFALRYASVSLVRRAIAPGQRLRRHLPPLLLLVALLALLLSVARPTALISLPTVHESVILAIDLSGSMRATDVAPTRIAAAQAAARAFVAEQPKNTRIGIVSFAATASVVQIPTTDRQAILEAIDRFQVQRGTAIGSAILVSLKLIFPDVDFDLHSANPRRKTSLGGAGAGAAQSQPPTARSVAPGSHGAAAIIMLSDGQSTTGPDPVESARMAAERGVRVFTVGVGTREGAIVGSEGWSMRVKLDEQTLKTVADTTRAKYYHAGDGARLEEIYRALSGTLSFERRESEVTALFTAAAALLSLLAAGLSVLWFGRAS